MRNLYIPGAPGQPPVRGGCHPRPARAPRSVELVRSGWPRRPTGRDVGAALVLAAATGASGGCFSPDFPEGLACSAERTCPPDQLCAADGICRPDHPPEGAARVFVTGGAYG